MNILPNNILGMIYQCSDTKSAKQLETVTKISIQ
jgi:hypothetical protein